jgi:hypothetical protein
MKAVGLRLDRRNSQKEKVRGTCAMLTRLSQGAFKNPGR